MPIYEYQCRECGRTFERLVFGKETPACPHCSCKDVCRQMSACGFVSKGSGGQTTRSSSSSSCGGCTAGSCAGCGH